MCENGLPVRSGSEKFGWKSGSATTAFLILFPVLVALILMFVRDDRARSFITVVGALVIACGSIFCADTVPVARDAPFCSPVDDCDGHDHRLPHRARDRGSRCASTSSSRASTTESRSPSRSPSISASCCSTSTLPLPSTSTWSTSSTSTTSRSSWRSSSASSVPHHRLRPGLHARTRGA